MATVKFYEHFGFVAFFRLPPDGEPGYVGLRRGAAELAVVDAAWPSDHYARPFGTGARFEMFVYVDDVDAAVGGLGDRAVVLREPADMPWGERVAYVADPDGNPVAVAQAASASP